MAKQVKYFYMTEKETGKTIEVRVKTTTEEFFKKLIADYWRRGTFNTTNVSVTPAQCGKSDTLVCIPESNTCGI